MRRRCPPPSLPPRRTRRPLGPAISWCSSPCPWPSSATPIAWSSRRRPARSKASSGSPGSRWAGCSPSSRSPTRRSRSRAAGWATGGAPRSCSCAWSPSGRSSPRPRAGYGATCPCSPAGSSSAWARPDASPISPRPSPTGSPVGSGCARRVSCGSRPAGEVPSPPPSWRCCFSTCPGGAPSRCSACSASSGECSSTSGTATTPRTTPR